MRERPMLFSASMVRAILAGRKTQTRRAKRVQPSGPAVAGYSLATNCPSGSPGDRLWVRETFAPICSSVDARLIEVYYRATYKHGDRMGDHLALKKPWTPSIHMPRSACRLVLEVTDVRVERLQAISAIDAEAEGLRRFPFEDAEAWAWEDGDHTGHASPTGAFRALWESTGADWNANPLVWVIGFRIAEGPANG